MSVTATVFLALFALSIGALVGWLLAVRASPATTTQKDLDDLAKLRLDLDQARKQRDAAFRDMTKLLGALADESNRAKRAELALKGLTDAQGASLLRNAGFGK
jgi:uncharacterized membrane-anchored protein YhcB (DUF1043 family)